MIRASMAIVSGFAIAQVCAAGAPIFAALFPSLLLDDPPFKYLVLLLFMSSMGALLGGWAAASIYRQAPRTIGTVLGFLLFALLLCQGWEMGAFEPGVNNVSKWCYVSQLLSIFVASTLGGVGAAVLARRRPSRLGA